jgi:histidine triad (HIT) family protein
MIMSDECLFCKIARKEVPSKTVHEDHDIVAFHDVNPVAPVHVLIVPKEHMDNLNEVGKADDVLLGKSLRLAAKLADDLGVGETGYRIVINNGAQGGQTIGHLHLHLIGGRQLEAKMG